MPRTFLKDAIMKWDNNRITDHNRSELSVDVDRIETANRMANGTRRAYVVADKRTFSTSWNNLPSSRSYTVDGFWGGDDIENWYNTKPGPFALAITHANGTIKEYTVVMTRFSKEIIKRGAYDMLQVSVEMEEV